MPRYDRQDPGCDQAYCDGLAPDPDIETCDCCLGDGWLYKHIDFSGHLAKVACPDCEGKGYYEELA